MEDGEGWRTVEEGKKKDSRREIFATLHHGDKFIIGIREEKTEIECMFCL